MMSFTMLPTKPTSSSDSMVTAFLQLFPFEVCRTG